VEVVADEVFELTSASCKRDKEIYACIQPTSWELKLVNVKLKYSILIRDGRNHTSDLITWSKVGHFVSTQLETHSDICMLDWTWEEGVEFSINLHKDKVFCGTCLKVKVSERLHAKLCVVGLHNIVKLFIMREFVCPFGEEAMNVTDQFNTL